VERVIHGYPGEHDAIVEKAIDPTRPRSADWYRIVDGRSADRTLLDAARDRCQPYVNYARDRHQRQVIMPI
jgi:hypothetical protein